MPPINRYAVSALALALLAILATIWLLVSAAPPAGFLVPAGLLLLALVGAARAMRAGRPGPARRRGLRLEADRLRSGRLRDYIVRAIGYHRQFQALAETFPNPSLRAVLARDLPVVEAAVRAMYDLCLALQAYEVGESQPPALARASRAKTARLTAEAEATLTNTLALLGQTYAHLRDAWSAPATGPLPPAAPFAGLPALTSRLRKLTAIFAPTAPLRPAGPGYST